MWKFHQTHPKTNMTMENPPLEDVFPIRKIGTFQCHVSFQGCKPLDNLNAQIDLPLNQAKGTDLTPLLIAPEVLHSRPKGLRAGTKFQILMDKLDGSLPKKDETWNFLDSCNLLEVLMVVEFKRCEKSVIVVTLPEKHHEIEAPGSSDLLEFLHGFFKTHAQVKQVKSLRPWGWLIQVH